MVVGKDIVKCDEKEEEEEEVKEMEFFYND